MIGKTLHTLSQISSVEAIFLSGSHVLGTFNTDSDIDLMVVCEPGLIWTTRWRVNTWLRRQKLLANSAKNHAGRFCPNHFITSDNLKRSDLNPYTQKLYPALKPLYDPNHLHAAFMVANGFKSADGDIKFVTLEKKFPRKEVMMETIYKWLQIGKIRLNPSTYLPDAQIVLNDQEIRLHARPKSAKN